MLATAKSCKCRRPFASFHMTQAKKQYSMFDHVLAGVVTKAQRLCSHHLTLGRAQVDQGHPTSNGVIMCMLFLTVNRPSLTVTKVQSGDLVHVIARWHTSTRATRYSDLRLNRLVWSVGIQRVSRTRHVPLAKQGGIRSSESSRGEVLGPSMLSR